MTNTPEETARCFEHLAQLLENKRKSTDKASSKKSKGKRKEGESSFSVHIEEKEQSDSESSKSSYKEEGNPDHRSIHSKRMSQFGATSESPYQPEMPPRIKSDPAVSGRVGPCSIHS